MKLKDKLLRYSMYRNMLLSSFFLTCVIVILFCVVVYAYFSKSVLEEVGTVSESMLTQTSYVADIIHSQVHDIGNHLINNRTMVSAMFNERIDRVQEYLVVSELSAVQSTYPFIQYIGIFNGTTNRYMNNRGVTYEDERPLFDMATQEAAKSYSRFIPRKVFEETSNRTSNLLTFVLLPGYSSYFPKNGGIVVNVGESYIQELLEALMNEKTGFLIVTDRGGTVLSRTSGDRFLEDASRESYIRSILDSEERAGSFLAEVDGKKHLVSFVKSDELQWNFISVNEYDKLLFNLNHMRGIVLAIAAGLILLGLVLSYWLTNYMYNPLEQLMKRIAGLQKSGPIVSRRVNEFYMLSEAFHNVQKKATLLEPALSVAQRNRLLHYIKGIDADPANRFYEAPDEGRRFVVLLKFDDYRRFRQQHDDKTQSLIRFAVCNIAHELTGMDAVISEDDEIVIVGAVAGDARHPEAVQAAREIKRYVEEYFRLSLTIVIGPTVRGAKNLRQSYEAAKELLQERFLAGGGHLFEADAQRFRGEPKEDADPPSEEKLIETIQRHKRDEISEEIRSIVNAVRRLPYDRAIFTLNQLLVTMFRSFDSAGPGAREKARSFMHLASSLTNFERIEELHEAFEEACGAMCDAMEAAAKNKNNDVIDEIKAYIHTHFARHDLSLEGLAHHYQLTPGYLGKLFRTACQISFNDYVKQIRLEKACGLLRDTRDPANVISEKIGILNTTYFYTIFKKRYGVSPAQYRAQFIKGRLLKEESNGTAD